MIKEFEASHGTVADLWHAHNAGKETSMNPLGMVDALLCAMNHAATLALLDVEDDFDNCKKEQAEGILHYTALVKKAMHNTFRYGQGAWKAISIVLPNLLSHIVHIMYLFTASSQCIR